MNFLADENLSRRFVNALRRHNATINIVRVQEVGLLGMDDAAILDWAVDNNYVLITKDRATISPLVAQRLVKDIPSPRIFIIRPGFQLNAVLAMIEAVIAHDPDTDWQYPVRWIP
jgi:predicted nuclease of predicted toxin-antitoxin system